MSKPNLPLRRLGATLSLALFALTTPACLTQDNADAAEEADLVPQSATTDAGSGGAEDLQQAPRYTAILEGELAFKLGAMDPTDLATWMPFVEALSAASEAEEAEGSTGSLSASDVGTSLFAARQLTFGTLQLAEAGLQLDLAATRSVLTRFELSAGGVLRLGYQAQLVLFGEAGEQGRGGAAALPEALEIGLQLPEDPWSLMQRAGSRCLAEGHENASPQRYAFYFDPSREGCTPAIAAAGLGIQTQTLRVQPVPIEVVRWPEYAALAADAAVETLIVAAPVSAGWDPGQPDPSLRDLRELEDLLQERGFVLQPQTPADQGLRSLVREVEIDEEVFQRQVIRLAGPTLLAAALSTTGRAGELSTDPADPEAAAALSKALGRAELLVLWGDASQQALNLLPATGSAEEAAKILVLDGVYDYAKTALNLSAQFGIQPDLIVNAAPSVAVGRQARTRILLTNLLRGARSGGVEDQRYYSWDRILATVNRAGSASATGSHEVHALFVSSGLEDNLYQP